MTVEYTINIGSRVTCQDYAGTVKYIGPVDGYEGEWIGMDWDDEERGKHNGFVNGKQYFTTRYSKSGSLVRRNKIDIGSEFVDALETRYLNMEDTEYLNPILLEECKKVLNTANFEVVGLSKIARKQSNLHNIVNICLASGKISHVNIDKLEGLCPCAEELTLTNNLLSNWKTVTDIVGAMPRLRVLDLSKNIIECNEEEMLNLSKKFPALESLLLSKCHLTFDDAISISKMLPSLVEIRFAMNDITKLSKIDDNIFQNVKELSLDMNNIQDWEEIMKLGDLKTLEILHISQIGLKNIALPECGENEKCNLFENLRTLSINDNEIDNWRSVSELNKLKNLKSLCILKNPIIQNTNYLESWSQVVARVLNLKILNHSEIAIEERRGAEYDILKLHGMSWMHCSTDPVLKKQFIDEINSYPALIAKYGAPEVSLCEKPVLPRSKLLKVNITSTRGTKTLVKKLPVKMTVQSLLGLIQKCFDTGSDVPTLYYTSLSNPGMKIELNNVTKNLDYFSLQDNDTIIADW